jgi:hypothetical protein
MLHPEIFGIVMRKMSDLTRDSRGSAIRNGGGLLAIWHGALLGRVRFLKLVALNPRPARPGSGPAFVHDLRLGRLDLQQAALY